MAFSYRLYGDLYLDDPVQHLDKQYLEHLRVLEPHFRNLESHSCGIPVGTELDYKDAFAKFAEQESKLWQPPRRRDEVVPPSGQYQSRLAHHLHNPSFHTLTPHNGDTADETNLCIYLVMQSGFVKGHTFIFDHLCRREIVDGIRKYPPHILRCHEEFTAYLRSNMHAEVEVVWGKIVRVRMLELYHKNGNELEPLRLWGLYKDVTVFLEWDKSVRDATKRLVRFIIFVAHPQIFLTPSWFKFAPIQDLHLSVAGKLSRTVMTENFFQSNPQSHKRLFVSRAAYAQAEPLGQLALNAVLSSSKEPMNRDGYMEKLQTNKATISSSLPEQWQSAQSTHKRKRPKARSLEGSKSEVVPIQQHRELTGLLGSTIGNINDRIAAGKTNDSRFTDSCISQPPVEQPFFKPLLVEHLQGCDVVIASFGTRKNTRLSTNCLKDLLHHSIQMMWHQELLLWDETGDVGFLPDCIRHWLEDQSNDWPNGKTITSSSELRPIHKHYTGRTLPEFTPTDLVFDLMLLHLQRLRSTKRRFKIDNDAFTRVFGTQSVMQVECCCCGRSLPDDKHPRYVVKNPDRYIVREYACSYSQSKAISKNSNTKRVHAVPVNKSIAYVLPNEGSRHARISKDVSTRGPRVQLVRPQDDCSDLPKDVEVFCSVCSKDARQQNLEQGTNKILDLDPQWTTSNPPRYVARRRMCSSCGKQNLFLPCNASIPAITKKSLSDLERGYPGISTAELTMILSSRWPTRPWINIGDGENLAENSFSELGRNTEYRNTTFMTTEISQQV